jgi:hypothetical protein
MNWKCVKLNKIQAIEDDMIMNKLGSLGTTFTDLIYNTSKWIDSKNPKEVLTIVYHTHYVIPEGKAYNHYNTSPECIEEATNTVARLIESGHNLNVACKMSGYPYNILRKFITPEHKAKFQIARELKFKNSL